MKGNREVCGNVVMLLQNADLHIVLPLDMLFYGDSLLFNHKLRNRIVIIDFSMSFLAGEKDNTGKIHKTYSPKKSVRSQFRRKAALIE